MPEDYYGDRYTELNRQLGMRERSRKRQSRESAASRGTIYSGHTETQERDIEAQSGEEFRAGARDIEDRRWRASQDEIARQHQTSEREGTQGWQTGEREGSQLFQTGEREGTQSWQSGENEATRQIQLELQKMSDAARFELQQLVISGEMTLQEAEQKWTSYESNLARELEWRTSEGQWEHEMETQKYATGQEQWMAQFGAQAAMDLQMNTQDFEAMMAQTGRDWELADRPWQEQMWLMDAQLQMIVSGYDWLNDERAGGPPDWMFQDAYDAEGNLMPWYSTHHGEGGTGGLDMGGGDTPYGTAWADYVAWLALQGLPPESGTPEGFTAWAQGGGA